MSSYRIRILATMESDEDEYPSQEAADEAAKQIAANMALDYVCAADVIDVVAS